MSLEMVSLAFLPVLAAGISFAFYQRKLPKPGEGKRIEAVPGGRFVIMLAQFFVPLLVSASLLTQHAWLLPIPGLPSMRLAGFVLGGLGLCLFLAAKLKLGTNYSPCYDSVLPQGITQTGVYGFIRHPIYTANLLLIMAAFLLAPSFWVLGVWILMAWLYLRTARIEEAALAARFPEYPVYMATTGRFLPSVKGLRQP